MSGWRYAFSLTKDEVASSEPPGTVKSIEHEFTRTATGTERQRDHIQLVPKPSSSPADPLNWPEWRKYAILFTMSLYAWGSTFAAALLAPALPLLQYQFLPPRPLGTVTHLISVNVLLAGCGSIVVVPLANIVGRRPVLVISILIVTLASMWAGLATSFESLLGARAIQGFGMAAAESIAPDVLGETFFLHERGRVMAIYTGFLGVGSFMSGVVGGYVAYNLGYRYIFWISTAIFGFTFLCQILLVPETLFDRERHLQKEARIQQATQDGELKHKTNVEVHDQAVSHEEFTYLQSLKVWAVYRGDVIRQFVAPWYSLLFPGTWVVMLQYGGLLGGIVTMATVSPILLSMPPYLWGQNVDLLNLGGVIGNVLAAVITYLVADRLTQLVAGRNTTGLAEPETRLIAMVPALFFATTGNWVFGFCANNPSPQAWAGLAVGLGMLAYGVVQIPSIGFNYLIDAYFAISNDCFVMTAISRSIVSFVWTFFISDWIFSASAALPFGIFGMLMGIFSLLTIPLYFYGKRMRIATTNLLPTQVNH